LFLCCFSDWILKSNIDLKYFATLVWHWRLSLAYGKLGIQPIKQKNSSQLDVLGILLCCVVYALGLCWIFAWYSLRLQIKSQIILFRRIVHQN